MMCRSRVRQVCCLVLVACCFHLAGSSAWGSSSGLNNIPTTEITPENILVFQNWGNYAGGEHPSQFVGFKYGLLKDVEIGVDWKASDHPHGHAVFQAKYAFDIDGDVLRGVIGVADFSDNRAHNGYMFPYAAMSLDCNVLNLHFGYAPQAHNERFFGGFDKTVSFLDRNLKLRFDGIHINDKDDMLLSAGFLYELAPQSQGDTMPQSGLAGVLSEITKNIVLESWVSKPSTGDKETYTVKLNYVVRF
jgi:hypothetical protein